jgi:DAK2 domain fusion protein YloV
MSIDVTPRTIDGYDFKDLLHAGVVWVAQHTDAINQMNVFPVPDGDTGTNMVHTLRRAYAEIAPLDTNNVAQIAQGFAHGALMGARGNSGTILSQILKGFADGLGDNPTLSPATMLKACQQAVTLAYQAVTEPVEGTILTVAREATETLTTRYHEDITLAQMLDTLTSSAEQSLHNTPNLLPILKEAGVVDSGGMGLFIFLQGIANFQQRHTMPDVATSTSDWQTAIAPPTHDSYGYDVQFLMLGDHLDVATIRRDFEDMGWSVLVVGDANMVKVHIHVHNPADPFAYAIQLGAELDDIVVENMQRQYQDYVQARQSSPTAQVALPNHGIAVVSVANGDGIEAIFKDLQCAYVISGGQTLNPSTEDFIHAIETLPTDKVIILPNNSNIILTAEQTARLLTHKDIRIIPTKTMLHGISAMIAYGVDSEADISLDDMIETMREAVDYVQSIEITQAVRSTEIDGKAVTKGHYLGILNGHIMAVSDTIEATIDEIFDILDTQSHEIVTVYYGDGISETEANTLIEHLSKGTKGLEFEIVYGGQPLYPYLISVE